MRSGFEDWDFFLSILETFPESWIGIVNQPLIQYRTAPASSNIKRMDKRLELMRFIRYIYTAITMLSSVLYLCNGVYEDPSGNWHELDRAIILLIGIAAFELYTNLPVKPLALKYLIAYIPSQLLAFAYVWFSGLREPLAKTEYRDIWINFTGLFVLSCCITASISEKEQKGLWMN